MWGCHGGHWHGVGIGLVRTLDMSSLRADLGVGFSTHVAITLWSHGVGSRVITGPTDGSNRSVRGRAHQGRFSRLAHQRGEGIHMTLLVRMLIDLNLERSGVVHHWHSSLLWWMMLLLAIKTVITDGSIQVWGHGPCAAGRRVRSMGRVRVGLLRLFQHNTILSQPFLDHLMDQAIMPDKATLVFGLMSTRRALVRVTLLEALAKLLSVMTVCQVAQEHVAAGEVILAQRTRLAIAFQSFKSLENSFVVAIGLARVLVENSQHHLVVDPVMPDQELDVFALKSGANGTFEGRKGRQVAPQLLVKVFVCHMPQEMVRVQECVVAVRTRDRK